MTVPIYGKFSDVFGRKVMLMIGVGLFLIGSWLSGASQNMGREYIPRPEGLGVEVSPELLARFDLANLEGELRGAKHHRFSGGISAI